jgi:hypothetical protein
MRFLTLVSSLTLASCCLFSPVHAQVRIGEVAQTAIETPHPYPSGSASRPVVWSATLRHPGATFVKLHFTSFAVQGVVENGAPLGDYVVLKDQDGAVQETFSGILPGDLWARSIPGETVTIELHADAGRQATGLHIDRYAYGTVPLAHLNFSERLRPESTCGSDETAPICAAMVEDRIRVSDPVAALVIVNDCGGVFFCTGFLFTPDGRLMTAAHCANSEAEASSMEVWFNFVNNFTGAGTCSRPGRPNPDIFHARTLLQADCDLDMAIHLIDDPTKGNPAKVYGYMPLSDRAPMGAEPVWIPQHPGGVWKAIAEESAAVASSVVEGYNFCADPPTGCTAEGTPTGAFTDFGYTADTQGGSSGSPVLDTNNQVIGVHHAGGCSPGGGENAGVVMGHIIPLLQPRLIVKRLVLTYGAQRLTLNGQALLTDGMQIDPAVEAVTVVLRDQDGVIFNRMIPAGRFQRSGNGERWTFLDSSGTVAGGITNMVFSSTDGRFFRITAKGKKLNLSGADHEMITMEITVGGNTLPAKNVPCMAKGNTKTCRETPLL